MIACHKINSIVIFFTLFFLSLHSFCQQLTLSDAVKGNVRDIDFEVIGKMKGNILVFKNSKSDYAINIYDGNMQLVDERQLDFLPPNTFHVNFIASADSLYLVYQYEKKRIVHSAAARLNADVKLIADPVELDTTKIDWLGDNKVYTVINSDDKQKIMLFKIQRKSNTFYFATFLFDSQLKLIHQSRQSLPYNDREDVLSDFFLDNDGNLVFSKSTRDGPQGDVYKLKLITKPAQADTFAIKNIDLDHNYLDEVKVKIDNANKHYILNSFYVNNRSGNIDGLFSDIWDVQADSSLVKNFIPFNDSLRTVARLNGNKKSAFNDFFIRNIIVKKDGGYLVAAEDYSEQPGAGYNPWNRMNYLYGSPYAVTPYYYPGFYPGYRPFGFNNTSYVRYIYNNILIISLDKTANIQWNDIVHKDQYDDNNNDYLSFLNFNSMGQIHFVFNEFEKKNTLLQDNMIAADGTMTRNPPLKTDDKDYEFMPKFGKQVGAREVIIPCTYHSSICFAKIDF
jgi:hypothetical protein